jgi:glycogen synthase
MTSIMRSAEEEAMPQSARALRICFLCSDYPPGPHGGIGTMTQILARALVADGHQARVLGVYPRDYPAPERESDRGVRVERLREPDRPGGWLEARWRCYRQVARWAAAGEIDLVEVPDWSGWAAGWPRLPVPVVVRLNGSATYFGHEAGRPVRSVTRWIETCSLRRADFVASASRYTARQTEMLFGLRRPVDAILYNPIEHLPANDAPRPSSETVVFTGTLVEKKGVVSLVRAWHEVIRRRPAARLHLYGKDGRLASGHSVQCRLEDMLEEHRASVEFHGHVDRGTILAALRTARLAVFPSYAEAFALAPLEAMACGCPTIGTRLGSGPELITPEVDGLLVDPDHPHELSQAILRLLEDNALAERLGTAGRHRVTTTFSVDRLLAENVAFYRRCLKSPRYAGAHV